MNHIQEHISQLEHLRFQHLLNQDYEAFKSLCHPQLTYTHTSGKVDDYEGYLGKCFAGFYTYHHVQLDVNHIHLTENIALVFSDLQSEFTAGTDEKKLNNKTLSVWIKDQENWKFFAYQPTAII